MNSLNRDRWKEVDERFDKLSLKHYYPKKGSHVFEGFRANLHSELEKVRQEAEDNMRKRCLEALPKVIDIDDQTNYRESAYEDGVDDGFNKALYEVKQALLSLPDQEQLSNTKTE